MMFMTCGDICAIPVHLCRSRRIAGAKLRRALSCCTRKLISSVDHVRYKITEIHSRNTFVSMYESNPTAEDMSISEYKHIKTIEKGAFGTVKLAKHKGSGEFSAIKVARKSVVEKNMRNFKREKRISRSLDHPFISRMRHHFVDDSFVYFVMDYYPAGDFAGYLNEYFMLSVPEIKFYGAQIAMAIKFLHSLGVIHRDIKIENIFIDGDGYVKLGDFGMARTLKKNERAKSICGSMAYMAPEMLKTKKDKKLGYGPSADWWSYGVLMYILGSGVMPFANCSFSNYKDILEANLEYPNDMDSVVVDFLRKLITPDIDKRLGCGRGKDQKVLKHQLFADLDLTALYLKKVPSPLIPTFLLPHQVIPTGNFHAPIPREKPKTDDFVDF